jgi:hypothetical protein
MPIEGVHMKLKRTAAKTTFVGAMSIAAAVSTQGWHRLIHGARVRHRGRFRHLTTGQGANVAPPGNPALDYRLRVTAVRCRWMRPHPRGLSRHRRAFLGAVAAGRLEYGAQRLRRKWNGGFQTL